MARTTPASAALLARVRAHFGLDQPALALYLGISPEQVRSVEAGRRTLSAEVRLALLPLTQHLPPAAEAAAAEAAAPLHPTETPLAPTLPPGTPPPDAFALDVRRRVCLQNAGRLRAQHARLTARAAVAHRWAVALPALLAAAAPPPTADADALARAAWLADWLTRRARPLPPEAVTRWHRLGARVAALEAEAAALAVAN